MKIDDNCKEAIYLRHKIYKEECSFLKPNLSLLNVTDQ